MKSSTLPAERVPDEHAFCRDCGGPIAGGLCAYCRRGPEQAAAALSGAPDGAERAEQAPAQGPALGDLLAGVEAFVRLFVALSDAHAVAVALWVAHTHTIEAADATPYLAITSAEKRSGKTRLLETVEILVANPLRASNMSDAGLYRALDNGCVTLLLDEADAIFAPRSDRASLCGLLNAGYRRGSTAIRTEKEGGAFVVRAYDPFGAKALAAIGDLPDTIADRAIPIRLRRRHAAEPIARFRYREACAKGTLFRDALARWAQDASPDLRAARPDIPDVLDDRAADGWEPLLAIADMASGEWPERARAAALELHALDEREEGLGGLLLRHVREAFGDEERLTTVDLLSALCEREDGPWPAWWAADLDAGRSKGPASKLARKLKPFGVMPKALWIEGRAVKGYERAAFEDAWARYLPASRKVERTQVNGDIESKGAVPPLPLDGGPELDSFDLSTSKRGESESEALDLLSRELGAAQPPGGGLAYARARIKAGESNPFLVVREMNAAGFRRSNGRPWTRDALEAALREEEAP